MVIDNIAEYMDALGDRHYTVYEVSAIRAAIKKEFYERRAQGITINGRIKSGRLQINERVAAIIKRDYGFDLSNSDLQLYKKCFLSEYQDRTGRCGWGFKELRQRLGYDPETGIELCM